MKILLYGYGNPGRQDDGLGNAFIERIEKWLIQEGLNGNIETDSNYQLNIEDSEKVSDKDIVIFVDATEEPIKDIYLSKVEANDARIEFTMHATSPAFILDLCHKIYHKSPETYLLQIKGYEWDFIEKLTDKAKSNLYKALELCKILLKNPKEIAKLTNTDISTI